jgi:TusA-related sulfurtransferase
VITELDTNGMLCPRPVIELARLVRDLDDGAEVRVLSDDPAAPGDIAAWCRMRGHQLLSQTVSTAPPGPATSLVRVRRTPAATATSGPPPAAPGTRPG